MKRLLIVANWKSNLNRQEAGEWIKRFTNYDLRFTSKEIIVCPSFVYLPILKSYILDHKSAIKLGAQNISSFGEGAHTGDINGEQIKEFADYVIIGHSETRKELNETDEMLKEKVSEACKNNLNPIYCIQDESTLIPDGVKIIAYEPVFAIGTGNPDNPEDANKVGEIIKSQREVDLFLYGGSVIAENVHEFTKMPEIDGVLVGGASLDPHKFAEIVKNA